MFITSGVVTGIMQMLEEALRTTRTDNINVIGIMHWQSILHKDRLVQSTDYIKLPKYPVEERIEVDEVRIKAIFKQINPIQPGRDIFIPI